MMNKSKPFALISAERADRDDADNAQRTDLLHRLLDSNGFDFQLARGSWEGREERCFAVLLPDGDTGPQWDMLLQFATGFEQDAILHISACRYATLATPAEVLTGVGMWRELPEYQARQRPGWTQIRDRYFVAG